MSKRTGILSCLAAALSGTAFAEGAPPSVDHLFPAAAGPGETVSVAAIGKVDPWPPQIWTDAPDLHFKAGEKAGELEVTVDENAAPGPRQVRFFNAEGVSTPRVFIVAERPEIAEAEPNDNRSNAQQIPAFPATVSGRLERNGDVDSFAVTLRRGELLTARMEAALLGSPIDAMLRLTDETGTVLAFNHDAGTLDPCLVWEAPRDGVYTVQTMGFVWPADSGVRFAGGAGCVYRLHFATSKCCQETTESENNEVEPLEAPATARGEIARPREEDRFPFKAKAGAFYQISVAAARDGSALDGWLKIEDASGKELARNDDANDTPDPSLTWNAPEDGVYTIVVGDATRRGGPRFTYQLSIVEAPPAVSATASAHALTLQAGGETELKVTVKRLRGFQGKLRLEAGPLPEGISATPADAPEQDGEATLKLSAAPDAPAFNGVFIPVLRDVETGAGHAVEFPLTTTGNVNGVPQGFPHLLLDSTRILWLTVTRPPES